MYLPSTIIICQESWQSQDSGQHRYSGTKQLVLTKSGWEKIYELRWQSYKFFLSVQILIQVSLLFNPIPNGIYAQPIISLGAIFIQQHLTLLGPIYDPCMECWPILRSTSVAIRTKQFENIFKFDPDKTIFVWQKDFFLKIQKQSIEFIITIDRLI